MEFMINDIVSQQHNNFSEFSKHLHSIIESNNCTAVNNHFTSDLIDLELLEEIKRNKECLRIYFGTSLRRFKCVIEDTCGMRKLEVIVDYIGPRKLTIFSIDLPSSLLLSQSYTSLDEINNAVRTYLDDLSNYFYELEQIDKFCTVFEPLKPSFRDDYRKILLDHGILLYLEVTPEGLPINIHLIGQSQKWQEKLQEGLLNWCHDKNIADNIMIMFDLATFSLKSYEVRVSPMTECEEPAVTPHVCSICLCDELPDVPGVPQPLCQSASCGVYFHRSCLFQWLVACAGGRPLDFGIATGLCPTCLQPISCAENDIC